MSHTVISVENVSKRYRLGLIGGGTLHDDFERWWAKVRGKPDPLLKACPERKRRIGQEDHGHRQGEYIWALRDVSFEACPELVEGCSKAKCWAFLRLRSGQALAATGRAKAPLLRQAQYKAENPVQGNGPHLGAGQGQGSSGQPAGGLP